MPREIKCVNKQDRQNIHERITHVGGDINGVKWRLSQLEAIAELRRDKEAFFVTKNGSKVKVIIARSRYGFDYIKTEADGEDPNNLLSLNECR